MSAATFPVSASRPQWLRGPWIQSPVYDVTFFVLAPLLTLPILVGNYLKMPWLAIGGNIVLAFAHYISSSAFFLWDDNKPYHRARWIAFYAGPLVLTAVLLTLLVYDVPNIIQFVLFFWNTFHVARQNCGLLSIYRNKAGVSDRFQRDAANNAIVSVSLFLSMWNIGTHEQVAALFNLVSPNLGTVLFIASGAVAAFCLVRLGQAIVARVRGGGRLPFSELLLLATAIGFFYPFLIINDSEMATFVMLLPHYVQYMGIVWLLHRRRFTNVEGSLSQRALARVSRSAWLLVPLLAALGVCFYAFARVSTAAGYSRIFDAVFLVVVFQHFYLDGLIWSFKEPHVRQTIGSHLMRAPERA